jgi:deoxyribonuclease IV
MKLGAHVSISGGLGRVWARADADRCEAIQIFTQNGRGWSSRERDEGEVREFASEASRRCLPILAHDSYLVNLAAADRVVAEKSRAAFGQEIERCEALGVAFLVFHPGAHVGEGLEVGLPRVAAALRAALDASAGYRVSILVEITAGQGTCLGARFAEVRWILDEVGDAARTGVCFDTCHAYAAGYDLRDRYDEVWREFDAVLGRARLRAFHLNDSRRELGARVDRHAAIGAGALGRGFFRRLVRDPRFAGVPAVLELPPAAVGHGLAALRRWRGPAHA